MTTERHATPAERRALFEKLRATGKHHIVEQLEAGATTFEIDGVRLRFASALTTAPLLFSTPVETRTVPTPAPAPPSVARATPASVPARHPLQRAYDDEIDLFAEAAAIAGEDVGTPARASDDEEIDLLAEAAHA